MHRMLAFRRHSMLSIARYGLQVMRARASSYPSALPPRTKCMALLTRHPRVYCGHARVLLNLRRIHRRIDIAAMSSQGQGVGGYDDGRSDEELELGEFEEEEVRLPEFCPGCGVPMQIEDPEGPGYCRVPEKIMDMLVHGVVGEDEDDEHDGGEQGMFLEAEADIRETDEVGSVPEDTDFIKIQLDDDDDVDDGDFNEMLRALNLEEVSSVAGQPQKKKKVEAREPTPRVFATDDDEMEFDVFSDLVCARCYSLKHYGKVKSVEAEQLLPDFDVARCVGKAIQERQFRRAILLVVVDLADFDGSLPRLTIQAMVAEYLNKNFTFVIAANKCDLLPKQATKTRLEQWVRKRIAQGGLPRPAAVHIVSSHASTGIKTLLVDLQKSLGAGRSNSSDVTGDVWVVGAQNAGKSSLINAMKKAAGIRYGRAEVTAAPVPGTTLGVVPVTQGLVPNGCEMLDTPGVKHDYQITTMLGVDEVKMLLPRRQLKPRTYRLGEGSTIHIGGLARLDVTSVPGSTIYLTIWVSDEVRTHLGKTANAPQLFRSHVGRELTPPVAATQEDLDDRIMGSMSNKISTDVSVRGDSWKQSSVDICIAGLGWVGVGLAGEARITVSAPEGVAITTRDALVPDMAKEFCKPGFDKMLASVSSRTKAGKKTKKTKQRK
jgi:ribosome biogenesis GTPase A